VAKKATQVAFFILSHGTRRGSWPRGSADSVASAAISAISAISALSALI
jgi:hypothetical protein